MPRGTSSMSCFTKLTTDGLWCLAAACFALCGCRSFPPPAAQGASSNQPAALASTNHSVAVVTHYPRPPHYFRASQKLNPLWWFGNADDPLPPESYRPGKRCRNFMWHMRNPCHNFDFYIVGIADKTFLRAGRFPDRVSNPNKGWNWAVCRYKRWRLPFIDYTRARFEFYCGWRANGAFGIKLNFAKHKDPTAVNPPTKAPLGAP
jgi:hypothetical protein